MNNMKVSWFYIFYCCTSVALASAKTVWVKNLENENVLCNVPEDYKSVTSVNSKCLIYFDSYKNFEDASAYCKSIGSVAKITNQDEFEALSNLQLSQDAWINFKYNFNQRSWFYGATNSRVSDVVLKWKSTSTGRINDCGKVLKSGKSWSGMQCGVRTHYICETVGELQTKYCTNSRKKNQCYFSLSSSNYWTGFESCEKMNATLITPKTREEWNIVSSYINNKWQSITTQKVWLGLIFKPQGTKWLWADGKEITRSRLAFPYGQTAFQQPNSNFGKCGVFTKQGQQLLMNTEHCGNTKALALCQIQKEEPQVITTTAQTSPSEATTTIVDEISYNTTQEFTTTFQDDLNGNHTVAENGGTTAIIIGCVVGGVILIAIIILIIILCLRSKRSENEKSEKAINGHVIANGNAISEKSNSGISRHSDLSNYPEQMKWNNNKTPEMPIATYNGIEPTRHPLKHSISMPARKLPSRNTMLSLSSMDAGPVANSTLSNQVDNESVMREVEKAQKPPQKKVKLRKRVTAPILRLSGFAMVNNKKNAPEIGIKGYDAHIQFQRQEYMDSDFSSFTSWEESDQESVIQSTEMERKYQHNAKKKRNSFHLAYMNVNERDTIDSQNSVKDQLNKSHSYMNVETNQLNSNHPDVVPQIDGNDQPKYRRQDDELPEISEIDQLSRRPSTTSTHVYESIDTDPHNLQEARRQDSIEKSNTSPIKKIIAKVPSKGKKSNKTIKQSGEIGPDIILSVPPIRRSRNSASTWEMVATPAMVLMERKNKEKELETITEDHNMADNYDVIAAS